MSFLGKKFEQFCERMINGVINTVFWGETLFNPITINYKSKFSSNNVFHSEKIVVLLNTIDLKKISRTNWVTFTKEFFRNIFPPIFENISYFIHFFLAFCWVAPLGGVTGRPAFRPPYGNFFLSAGFKIWKEHIKVSSTDIIAPERNYNYFKSMK